MPTRYGNDEYVDTAFVSGGRLEEPQNIEEALESKLSKEWKIVADSDSHSWGNYN